MQFDILCSLFHQEGSLRILDMVKFRPMLQMSIADQDGLSGALVLKLAEHSVFVASLRVLFLLVFEPGTDLPEVNQLIVNKHPL